MDLLPFLVSAALFLVLEFLLCRPDRLLRASRDRPPAPDQRSSGAELFSLDFVRRRLTALAAELAWLDADPDVFAKAFRLRVARAARDALLEDEARLAAAAVLEWEVVAAVRSGPREELEV